MALFKTQNTQTISLSPRAQLERKYLSGRMTLLAAIIFTVISVIMLTLSDTYFLFSIFLPVSFYYSYLLDYRVATGAISMQDALEMGYSTDSLAYVYETDPYYFLGIGIGVVVVIIAIYLVLWLLSKKHPAMLIVATVFFTLDTAYLLLGFDVSMIIDILFHIYMIGSMIIAIVSSFKLKKLPPESVPAEGEIRDLSQQNAEGAEAIASPTASYDSVAEGATQTAPEESDRSDVQ